MNSNFFKALTFWLLMAGLLMLALSGVKKAQTPTPMLYSEFLTLAQKGDLSTAGGDWSSRTGRAPSATPSRGKKKDGTDYEVMAPLGRPGPLRHPA